MSVSSLSRLPKWIVSWLVLTTVVCTWDASFIVFRPHTFPKGKFGTIWYPYKYYIELDKRYQDMTDSFVFSQSLLNYAEAILNILSCYFIIAYSASLQMHFKLCSLFSIVHRDNHVEHVALLTSAGRASPQETCALAGKPAQAHWLQSEHAVPMALTVTVMTFWKTVLYFLMWIYGDATYRKGNSSMKELVLVVIPNGVWVVVPLVAMVALWRRIVSRTNLKKIT